MTLRRQSMTHIPQGDRLDYSDPPAMAPTVNIAHRINETSPLHGLSADDISRDEGGIYISVSATDSSSLQAWLLDLPLSPPLSLSLSLSLSPPL